MNPMEIVPHSDDAEQSIIGALMIDAKAYDRIASLIKPADFYREQNRVLYGVIVAMIASGKDADVVTVFESLKRSGKEERAGGLAYLGEIMANTPSAANIKRYAEIVREKSLLRALIAAGQSLHDSALIPDGVTAKEKLEAAQTHLSSIAEGAAADDGPVSIAEAVAETLQSMQDTLDGNGPQRYKTGLADLDNVLYDFAPGELVIVAGRPGMGKTSLALQMADTVADDDTPGVVAIFSLEMPAKQLTQRLLSRKTGIDLQRLIAADLTDDEWSSLTFASGKMYEQKIYIDDRSAQRASDIRAKCNIIRRKQGLKLIVVDYLQLMTGKGDNRTQEIGGISRDLKAIAKDFGVPVVALSQLNRGLESRPNKRPVMADLRESGDIEQDASLIVFVYRDELYNPDSPDKGTAEHIVGKQRNGPSGDHVRVAWHGPTATFKNLDFGEWFKSRPMNEPSKPKKRGFAAD